VKPVVGGIGMAFLAILVAGTYALKKAEWLPSLLFAAAFLLFFAGLAYGHVLVEGLAVMVAVILATGVAFASEYKSDREFEILNTRKESLQAKVMRAGNFHTIALEEVVVGDIILLEMGDEIPADGRVLKATELFIDQSLMTGESEPVKKIARGETATEDGPEQPGCLYRGTQVVDGAGQMLVTEVGDATYLGQIARRLSLDHEDEETPQNSEEDRIKRKLTMAKDLTPLQGKTEKTRRPDQQRRLRRRRPHRPRPVHSRHLQTATCFLPGTKEGFGPDLLTVLKNLLDYFVMMVIIIVVAVPEGLPMSVTVPPSPSPCAK